MKTSNSLPPQIGPTDKVILFDGVCNLCAAWTQFVIKYDTEQLFKLCSVQSEPGQELLRHFGYRTDDFDTMVYVEGQRAYDQGDAFLQIISQFPLPWKLLGIGKIFPRFVRNWLYRRVASNRYALFGKSDTCMMPTPATQARFL